MRSHRPVRVALATSLTLLSAVALCQTPASFSKLPASSPTSSTPGSSATARTPHPARPAQVAYSGGSLTISANNSSLNQILREISRLTGMKITGGVQEDRVFGDYGPAPATEVLTALLDGTATNLLIVENSAEAPSELIFTPRQGGPTPPNPNAAQSDNDDDASRDVPPQLSLPAQQPPPQQQGQGRFQPAPGLGGLPPSNGGQTGTPISGGADLGTTPGAFAPPGQTPPDATAQGTPSTTNQTSTTTQTTPVDPTQPQSPNGVATPQQIYEQLQRLREQQPPPSQNPPTQ